MSSEDAAMLVHQVGSGIETIEKMPIALALENLDALQESYFVFSRFVLRLSEIELVKHAQLRAHQ